MPHINKFMTMQGTSAIYQILQKLLLEHKKEINSEETFATPHNYILSQKEKKNLSSYTHTI